MVFSDSTYSSYVVLEDDISNNLDVNISSSWTVGYYGVINDVTLNSFGHIHLISNNDKLSVYSTNGTKLYGKALGTSVNRYNDCYDTVCFIKISSSSTISIAEFEIYYQSSKYVDKALTGFMTSSATDKGFDKLIDGNTGTTALTLTSGSIYIDVSYAPFDEIRITHGAAQTFSISINNFWSTTITGTASLTQSTSVSYPNTPFLGFALDSKNGMYYTTYYDSHILVDLFECASDRFYYSGIPDTNCTMIPTPAPTQVPTPKPTYEPTYKPTRRPSFEPTRKPTRKPTSEPTSKPTGQPTMQPSSDPSRQPSSQPSRQPTTQPSSKPSRQPSSQPSGQPSSQPSSRPSSQPSRQPSSQPSRQPSCQPSSRPTQPTGHPTMQPSTQPSSKPSSQPSLHPSGQPTSQPTADPTCQPSVQPSCQPSVQPSCQPSSQPSGQPSSTPTTLTPSSHPTCQPSRQPSSQPSVMPTLEKLAINVDTSLYKTGFVNTFYNKYAFAATTINGVVIAWGDPVSGGDISSRTGSTGNTNVIKVVSSFHSFAALKSDGTVFAWGQVVISNSIQLLLTGVRDVVSNGKDTYACIKTDGTVVTFGNSKYGGNIVLTSRPFIVSVYATTGAFASLSNDRSVYAWGDSLTGGLLTSSPFNIVNIVANRGAFAAVSRTGSVFIWGNEQYGGSASSDVLSALSFSVAYVFANPRSFVALKKDSTLVTWGESNSGGSNPYIGTSPVIDIVGNALAYAVIIKNGQSTQVRSWGDDRTGGGFSSASFPLRNVAKLFANDHAFAALTSNGTIFTFGDAASGGDSSYVSANLTANKYSFVSSTKRAFAAYLSSSSSSQFTPPYIVTWGHPQYGGNSSNVATALQALSLDNPIKKICANDVAFTALFLNGSIVSWGHSDYGGTTPNIIDEIVDCHPSSSDATNNTDITVKVPTLNPTRAPTTTPVYESCKNALEKRVRADGVLLLTMFGTMQPTSHYCLQNSSYNGGGWTLLLSQNDSGIIIIIIIITILLLSYYYQLILQLEQIMLSL
jgi:alpha-tubulin suppressor-like RCC1 family protein